LQKFSDTKRLRKFKTPNKLSSGGVQRFAKRYDTAAGNVLDIEI
jgi:hypothetical protein